MHPISPEAKKELIEALKDGKRKDGLDNSFELGKDCGINFAMFVVESFPTSSDGLGDSTSEPSENRWIPVTERLPELTPTGRSNRVLSCDIYGRVRENCYLYGDELEEGEWEENEEEVTHWQELPKPPVT